MKPGDRVRHKGTGLIRHIDRRLKGIPGGVLLDADVDGFRCWNVRDLILLNPPAGKPRLVQKHARHQGPARREVTALKPKTRGTRWQTKR